MKTWTIYCHLNKINGKRYIGQTYNNVNNRWRGGLGYKTQTIFYRAIQKYGWNNFEHIILATNIFSQEEANNLEAYYISYYHTYIGDPQCNGYNSKPDSHTITEDIAKKVSNSKNGTKCNFRTEESNAKGLATKLARYGTLNLTQETKKKISKSLQGHYVSKETRQKISLAGLGRVPPNAKPVICIETGVEYQSAGYVEKLFNFPKNSVQRCCKGKQTSVHGLHWKYKENKK